MTRKILATVAAALASAMLLSPAAQACISCEYVPEVVKANAAKSHGKKRIYTAKAAPAKASPSKQRLAKALPTAKPAAKPVQTAKAAPAETPAVTETETETTAEAAPEADADTSVKVADAGNDVGCKKFIPTVGVTVTVPCE